MGDLQFSTHRAVSHEPLQIRAAAADDLEHVMLGARAAYSTSRPQP